MRGIELASLLWPGTEQPNATIDVTTGDQLLTDEGFPLV